MNKETKNCIVCEGKFRARERKLTCCTFCSRIYYRIYKRLYARWRREKVKEYF